jgi:hypothetical protein
MAPCNCAGARIIYTVFNLYTRDERLRTRRQGHRGDALGVRNGVVESLYGAEDGDEERCDAGVIQGS